VAHVRKQLRTAVETAVGTVEGLTHLQPNRLSISATELPSFRVLARQESVDAETMQYVDRKVMVHVIVNAEATDNLDDVLDDWSAQIEPVVLSDNGIAGLVSYIAYVGAEISNQSTGETQNGAIQIGFEAVLLTAHGQPETIQT